MVSGGYQQPQRGPPQQDPYRSQHDQRYRQHFPPEPQANHRQQYNHTQYRDTDVQEWDDQYARNQQWDGRHYEDQHEAGLVQAQQSYSESGYRQDRTYHYDDRYHNGGGSRPQPRRQQSYGSSGRGGIQQTPGQQSPVDTRPPPKARERILQSQPESPKTAPWDNPFGAFPSKKKQGEDGPPTSTEQWSEKQNSPDNSRHQSRRPSTSHEHSYSAQSGRPSTSHGQRGQGPSNFQHQNPNGSRGHSSHGQRQDRPHDYGMRRPPQRAMTGPLPQESYDNYGSVPTPEGSSRPYFPDHNPGPALQTRDQPRQTRTSNNRQPPRSDSQGMPTHYQRRVSGENYHHGDNFQHSGHDYFTPEQDHGRHAALSSGSSRAVVNEKIPSPDVPNFDAMTNNTNEDQLAVSYHAKSTQPYQKAAYDAGTQNSAPIAARTDGVNNKLSSDFAQFSFDLPTDTGTLSSTSNLPLRTQTPQQSRYEPELQTPTDTHGAPYTSGAQHLPRMASRGNMRSIPTMQYDQPPLPEQEYIRPPNAMQRSGTYEGGTMSEAYQTYDSSDKFSRQSTPAHDPSRSGFDPRLLPRGNGTPGPQPPYQNQPPRPRTSNSAHQLQSSHGRRPSSESFQQSIRSNTDSLPPRPVPFRPGLNQAPPQPPTPVDAPPPPQTRHSGPLKKVASPPVTPQELNTLRDAFRNNPTDHGLGLRFAKKLVEASKVLVNDNGSRMDPKQIAKNRERYVLDAHKVIKKLVNAGDAEAMFYMADCYGQGLLGLQADSKEAFSLYQSAAKLGHAQGAYRVAVCCELGPEEGGGTRRDPLKAVQWYRRAASLGDPPAMYKMGMIQLKGLLGQPRNPREAISWLKRAAERADAENPHALHELGLLYESAQSTDIILRDDKYALQLFAQGAELGYKYSQFKLGSIYEYGLLGCPIDPRMSIAWYSRAAAQGEHQSEFALSGWYLTGGGQPAPGQQPLLQQSDTEAYLWARKAASSGLAKAEYAMGYYTEVGIGVAANVEDAKKWYFRAAAQQHPKARERLEELKRGGARMQKTRVSRSNVGKHNEGECTVM